MTAHNIARIGVCHVSGKHLSEAPNSPSFNDEAAMRASVRKVIARSEQEAISALHDDERRTGFDSVAQEDTRE